MRMQVSEDVTLYNPLGDGRDYSAGMEIELPAEVAREWERRGWVRPTTSRTDDTPTTARGRARPRSAATIKEETDGAIE